MSKTVLVLSGTGNPARAAANIYAEELSQAGCTVHIVENTISISLIGQFFFRRLRRFGLLHTISTFMLRLSFLNAKAIDRSYRVDFTLQDLSLLDDSYLDRIRPDLVIANACSILDRKLIARLRGRGAQIINVHNGVNPRYRGGGNIWSFYERNFEMAGVTLHHLDEGIDTGEIISIRHIDFRGLGVAFEETDILAFEVGARMGVQYALTGRIQDRKFDKRGRSRLYTYPSGREYRTAKMRYETALRNPQELEKIWQASFENLASNAEKDIYQRQHWGNSNSVDHRDSLIRDLLGRRRALEHGPILDLGCGDGRYRRFWPGRDYWGYDYSLETIELGGELNSVTIQEPPLSGEEARSFTDNHGNHFVIGSVDAMPFLNDSFPDVLAIGLFQHIDNTGVSADEIIRVTKPDGRIIINTLRHFSLFELAIILALGLFRPNVFSTALAILREDYFSGREIEGVKLARRYRAKELVELFRPQAHLADIRYSGLFGTRFLSRELTLVFRKKA